MRQFIIGSIAIFALVGFASAQSGDERILRFHSEITVNKDGSLDVVETIEVRTAQRKIKRGIFRDFPTVYHRSDSRIGKLIKKKIPFTVRSIKRDGRTESYHIRREQAGKRIYIGQENYILPRGVYQYEISYQTDRQILEDEDATELYWNVTGNAWDFPIDSATATIHLPGGATVLGAFGYVGKLGASDESFEIAVDQPLLLKSPRPLGRQEGFTIKAFWPKGIVDIKPYGLGAVLKDNLAIVGAFLAFILSIFYYLFAWFKVGRDPEAGTIIPLYEPPPGFSPAAVRYLAKMRFDDKAFSASIIHLAVNKCLEIKEEKKKTFTLILGESPPAELEAEEVKLFRNLFTASKTLELKNENHKRISKAKNHLKKALAAKIEKTHFLRNTRYWLPGVFLSILPMLLIIVAANGWAGIPMAGFVAVWSGVVAFLISTYLQMAKGRGILGYIANPLIIFVVVFGGFWVGMIIGMGGLDFGPLLMAVGVLSMVTTLLFYQLIKAPTHAGRKVLDHIEGFRKYLSVAEKDRLNLENPPERTPELFEKFLPYALALDVDQEWGEQFTEILEAASRNPDGTTKGHYHPHWYAGTGNFTTASAAALGGAVAGALAASSVSPNSGGSSSGGGGGFSGGGGGGGGGGGW